MAKRKRLQFGLRSLFVGVAAAAVAVAITTWMEVPGDIVIVVAALAAVFIEATVYKRGLRWMWQKRQRK